MTPTEKIKNLNVRMIHQTEQLVKPARNILASLTAEKCDIFHMVWGISGELLELQLGILNEDMANVIEEAGDTEFYLAHLCRKLNIANNAGAILSSEYIEEYLASQTVEGRKYATSLTKLSESLLNNCKKYIIYDDASRLEKIVAVVEEIRVVLNITYAVYDRTLSRPFGSLFTTVMENNFVKLSGDDGRYSDGYTDEAAKIRADKK